MELIGPGGEIARPAFLKPWLVLLVFAGLVAVLRLSTFFASVIDWDESQYLLVADQWMQGHPPYTVVWDNKPPGTYLLFVLALKVFGRSVVSIRLLACLFVTATCYLVSRIGARVPRNGWLVGLLAGALAAVLLVRNDGRAANTEVFYLAFSTGAWLLVLSRVCSDERFSSRDYRRIALAGLLLGIGFEIKYVVVFDAVAIAAIFLLAVRRRPAEDRTPARIAGLLGAMGAGFLLPFVMVSLAFLLTQHFPEYWEQNFTSNRARTVGLSFRWAIPARGIWDQLRRQGIFWIGVPLSVIAVLRDRAAGAKDRFVVGTTAAYFAGLLACIVGVFRANLYAHYFLQLVGPLAVLGADAAVRIAFPATAEGRTRISRAGAAGAVAALAVVAFGIALTPVRHGAILVYHRVVKGQPNQEDRPALIADYLRPRMGPEDYLYVVDDQPVLHFLIPARVPTRYVFPAYLVRRLDLPDITGIEPARELESILDKKPVYIVKRRSDEDRDYDAEANRAFFAILHRRLDRDYALETTIQDVDLFRLKR